MKYAIKINHKDGTNSYLAHRGRHEWGIHTARRHLRDVEAQHAHNDPRWVDVDNFTLEPV